MSGDVTSNKKKYIVVGVIILGAAIWTLNSFLEIRFSSINKNFEDKLKPLLLEMGNTINVADFHPGNWSKVCLFGLEGDSFGSTVDINFMRAIEKKNDNIQYLNHLSGYRVTEDEWAMIFIYPPNMVEYYIFKFGSINFYISQNEEKRLLPFCEERERAIFVNVPLSERPKFKLISKHKYEHKIFLSLRSKD